MKKFLFFIFFQALFAVAHASDTAISYLDDKVLAGNSDFIGVVTIRSGSYDNGSYQLVAEVDFLIKGGGTGVFNLLSDFPLLVEPNILGQKYLIYAKKIKDDFYHVFHSEQSVVKVFNYSREDILSVKNFLKSRDENVDDYYESNDQLWIVACENDGDVSICNTLKSSADYAFKRKNYDTKSSLSAH